MDLRFEVTVRGQPPTERQLQLFATPNLIGIGQTLFVFCGFQGTCQDGATYHWDFPHVPVGTVVTYRFQVVTYPGYATAVFASGKFAATKDQTIKATFTYNAGTIPNTAVAPRGDASEALLPALGILLVLLVAAMSARHRRMELLPRISAE